MWIIWYKYKAYIWEIMKWKSPTLETIHFQPTARLWKILICSSASCWKVVYFRLAKLWTELADPLLDRGQCRHRQRTPRMHLGRCTWFLVALWSSHVQNKRKSIFIDHAYAACTQKVSLWVSKWINQLACYIIIRRGKNNCIKCFEA